MFGVMQNISFPKSLRCLIIACLLIVIYYHFTNLFEHVFDQYKYKTDNMNEIQEQLGGMFGLQTKLHKGNKSKQCESCSLNVPNLIIQYGTRRTATTLQFQILCLMMALLHEDEINYVGCYCDHKTVNKYTVMKTHNIFRLPISIPSNSWIFVTTSNALSLWPKRLFDWNRRKLKQRNFTIPYAADVELVKRRGHFIAYEYQSLFGMSDVNMQHIVEYLRYWDILRLCCGKQMSSDWRNHLLSNANHSHHHNFHNPTYPACEMYNISKVENLLLNTYVFKKFGHIASLRDTIGKVSTFDGILDGSYCERCNSNITSKHLQFNVRCA